jgi:hypothetical protein
MSKVTAPLLSFGASGQVAKTQIYSTWKGRPYVRRYAIPSNPNTAEQQATRTVFSWLNDAFKYFPGSAVAAWQAYANSLRITDRNAWIKANLSGLRGDTDLANLLLSPAANGGINAGAIGVAAGASKLTVTLTAPSVPTGWTVAKAWAACIKDQDPTSGTDFTITSGSDATDPYSIELTGLTTAALYRVGGWFEFTKPDGSTAYGQATMSSGTPS